MSDVVLVTGFLPFGGRERNPSGEVAERLGGTRFAGWRVEGVSLPVERARAFEAARHAIEQTSPRAVVALGLGAGPATVCVETTAWNLDDYESPDEAGERARGEPVVPGGSETLTASLAAGDLVEAIRAAGVPANVSHDAGRFLCNHIYYRLLDHGRRGEQGFDAIFLHLPLLPETVAAEGSEHPSLALELSRKAVEAVIGTLVPGPRRGDDREN